MSDIFNYGIKQLSDNLINKKISVKELVSAYKSKIIENNPKVNALITTCSDSDLDATINSAQLRIDNGTATPLTGIPICAKDNICTKDINTTCASKMLENFVPPYNATVIDRLNLDNAILLGKANMDEFAMGGSSQTSYFGGVKNPFNTLHVPGGSSGGSAASVAANMCTVALGSDTGGSIRQPAAFCGVTGLKPTYGLVSRYGLVAFASSLDQIGPIAKSAEDCAIMLNSIAHYDANDGTSKKVLVDDYTRKIGCSLSETTIGLPAEFFADGVDDEVKTAVLAAAKVYEQLGCRIKEVSLPSLKFAVAAYYLISSAEAASNLSRYDGIKFGYRSKNGETYEDLIKNTRREGFGDEVKRRIMLGNYALSSGYYDAYYNKAVQIRRKLKAEYSEIFENCSCILTPTTPTVAYKIGELENDVVKMYSADICTVTANIAGLPAISTTCGYSEKGMPIGMSIVGKAFDEATIVSIANAFEKQFSRKEAQL